MRNKALAALAAAALAAAGLFVPGAAAGAPARHGYEPVLNPADFVRSITNPYLPFPVGRTLIYRGIKDGVTQTEDLLVLSRARGGVLPVRLVQTTLPELLEDARRRHGLRYGRAARVSFEAAACAVRVDPVWFRQAVDNLLDNALRHTPAGGRVRVRAGVQGDVLTVVVEDTGPGFDEALLRTAFEPFVRSGGGPEGPRESAGLGLAVVRTIARAHGGRVRAQNRPEGGARVTMELNTGLTAGRPPGRDGPRPCAREPSAPQP